MTDIFKLSYELRIIASKIIYEHKEEFEFWCITNDMRLTAVRMMSKFSGGDLTYSESFHSIKLFVDGELPDYKKEIRKQKLNNLFKFEVIENKL